MKKKLLSILLAVSMLCSTIPTAFAAEEVAADDVIDSYEELQAAFDAAVDSEEAVEVVLGGNVKVDDKTLTVAKGAEVVLDLNGYTISGASKVQNHAMVENKGILTIDDNSDKCDGTVSYAFEGTPDTSYGKGNYTIRNTGTLIINDGIVENTTEAMSHMRDAIDNNSTSADAVLIINGGTVICEKYIAIRQFANSTAYANSVTINGGVITGGQRAVWMQLPGSSSSSIKKASLTVTDGILTSLDDVYNHAVYVNSSGDSAAETKVNISGGTFDGDVAFNGTACATLVEENVSVSGGDFNGAYGVYGYGEIAFDFITGGEFSTDYVSQYVAAENNVIYDYAAKIGEGETAEYYFSLADAIEAAEEDAEGNIPVVTLLKDIEDGTGVVVDKSVVIDLNDKTYTFASNAVGSVGTTTLGFQILKDHVVTIKNGTLTSVEGSGIKRIIQNYANLTLENVTIDGENLDESTSGANYTVSICNDKSGLYDVNITADKDDGDGCLAVGIISGYEAVSVFIDGGVYEGAIDCDMNSGTDWLAISGGTFTADPTAYLADDLMAVNTNGVYTVKEIPVVTPPSEGEGDTETDVPEYKPENLEKVEVSVNNAEVTDDNREEIRDEAKTEVAEKVTEIIPEDVDEEEAEEIVEAVVTVVTETTISEEHHEDETYEPEQTFNEVLADAAVETALTMDVDAAVAKAEEKLAEKNVTVSGSGQISVKVEATVKVEVKEIPVSGSADSAKTLVLDISPVVQTVASYDDGNEEVKVVVDEKEVDVQIPVSVTVPVPAAFANEYETVVVVHTKSNGQKYYHEAVVIDGKISFWNENGFSTFDVIKDITIGQLLTEEYGLAYKWAYETVSATIGMDVIHGYMADGAAAAQTAIDYVDALEVPAQLKDTKEALLTELAAVKNTIEKIDENILDSEVLEVESVAQLINDLNGHITNVKALADALGVVGNTALDQLYVVSGDVSDWAEDVAEAAYEWLMDTDAAFKAAYEAYVDQVYDDIAEIDVELADIVKAYMLEVPAEAMSIIFTAGEDAVAQLMAVSVVELSEDIDDFIAAISAIIELAEVQDLKAVIKDEAVVAAMKVVKAAQDKYIEVMNTPVGEAGKYAAELRAAKDNLINSQDALVDAVITAMNEHVDPAVVAAANAAWVALCDLAQDAANVGGAYAGFVGERFGTMAGSLLNMIIEKTMEYGPLAGEEIDELIRALIDEATGMLISTVIEALPGVDAALYDWLYNNPDKVIAFFAEYGDEIAALAEEYGDEALSVLAYIAFNYGDDVLDYIMENPEECLDLLTQWYDKYGYRVWPMIDVYLEELGVYEGIDNALESLDGVVGALVDRVLEEIETVIDGLEAAVEELKGQLEDLKAELEAKLEELENAAEDVKAEIEKAIAEIEKAIEEIEKAIAEIEAKINELVQIVKDINEAVEDIFAAIEMFGEDINAAVDALQAALEKLADAIGAAQDFVTELNAAIDEVQDVINGVIAALEEVGEIVAEVIDVLKDIEKALGEAAEAIVEIAAALEEAYEALVENANTAANAVLSCAAVKDGELSYVALGGATVAGEGYAKAVADAIALDVDVTANAYGAAELTYKTQLDYITANAGVIAEAELISYQLDANEVVAALVNAVLALEMGMGEYTAPDWSEYLDVESVISTVAEIEAEVQAVKAELLPYLDAETIACIEAAEADIAAKLAELADEETIEMVKPYVEQLVYSLVSYAVETAEAVEAIKAINAEAPVLLVGMYNMLDGVVVKMNGEEIDLGEYFDYVVKTVDVYNLVYAVASGNVTVVDVCEASVDAVEPIDMDNLSSVADLIAVLEKVEAIPTNTANEEGVEYIAAQIAAVLSVADHVWGDWAPVDTEIHERTCSVCGEKETGEHVWGDDKTCDICYGTLKDSEEDDDENPRPNGVGSVFMFTDVESDHPFYKEIMWAYNKGYIKGYNDGTFGPSNSLTRQHVWMVLARMDGKDPANMAEARAWAMSTGVSDGTNPGNAITRQQMVAMFYRYATLKGYDVSAEADITVFPDHHTVADYAKDAKEWAIAEGIIQGYTDGTLKAANLTNRGQFAAVLYRFCKAVK